MCPSRVLCATTDGPEATRSLAAALAGRLVDGDLVVLTGDLGAGKTCFTQGLGTGLGLGGDGRITSPTFTLAAVHDGGRLRLNHLDVYRLDDPGDALDLDLPELLEEGVTVIEWGERLGPVLPPDRLTIELRFPPIDGDGAGVDAGEDDQRDLRLELAGASWADRYADLDKALGRWSVLC